MYVIVSLPGELVHVCKEFSYKVENDLFFPILRGKRKIQSVEVNYFLPVKMQAGDLKPTNVLNAKVKNQIHQMKHWFF